MTSRYKLDNEFIRPALDRVGGPPRGKLVEYIKKNLQINVISLNEEEIVFDLIGVDASIANALRRILIAEVPTMAIENVYIWINNSIMQDEVLAHRLGLIPIKADPRWFEWIESPNAEPTDRDTIVFRLDVVCEQPEGEEQKTMTVYSSSLEWMPQGGQSEQFADEPIKPVYDDIIIAKLRPGQQIALEAHCRKGVGKDHAKYSPVSTASYRLLPEITVVTDAVQGELADELVAKCPMNVFDIEDLGGGRRTAVAARPRDCTVCRECIREDGWSERVKLERVADHFIFQVESTGILPPEVLVSEALGVLKAKCEKFVELAEGAERNVGYEDTEEA